MAEDYYTILGVPKTASPADIKAAYIRLAREKHPDRFTDPVKRNEAAQRFQLITESFNHLRDEKLRREYDKSLEDKAVPPQDKAKQRYRDGELLEQSREFNKALQYYYEAMQLDSNNPTYMLAVGRLLGKDRSKQRQAVTLLEELLQKAPTTREAYVELGGLYDRSGMHTRACRVYERGLKELPNDTELRSLLTQANAAAGRKK